MTIIIWVSLIILFIYTFGFSISLWNNKNKTGSIAVFLLAIATIVCSFFSVLK
ncbi:hypothetical protein KDN24_10905 [Bacillus sp. Bva_UNVM-123]|uniref:hypothetical protein n=1 Tax=Bacillus sp. Bva_UNVM-123 TaxID=2829798 RepID=UPI00391F8A1E